MNHLCKRLTKSAVILTAAMCLAPAALAADPPRLVVGIVVDQMRWDFLNTYRDSNSDGSGLARLLDEGFSCRNTLIDYVPTVTAAGHATIYTGTVPALHGIVGNGFVLHGERVTSVFDPTVESVGTESQSGHRSPRNLLALTIGDQMELASDGQSRIVGIALKDRAAILPAGHSTDGAYWYDGTTRSFITGSYYRDRLPDWVSRYNAEHREVLEADVWNTPAGVEATFGLAEAALEAERLGGDDVPDLLAVSVSSTDAAAHEYGNRSEQVERVYKALDARLDRFITLLDNKVGRENYVLFLTADHGGTFSLPHMHALRLPSAVWSASAARDSVNARLRQRFGVDDLIERQEQFSFYLNNGAIARHGLDRDAVARAACDALQVDDHIAWAVDLEHVNGRPIPQAMRERLVNGYYRGRSGEIYIEPTPGTYSGSEGHPGSNHSTATQSDSHIPFVLLGGGIAHGSTYAPTRMTDIAPTVCALIGIQCPNACVGQPVLPVVEQRK